MRHKLVTLQYHVCRRQAVDRHVSAVSIPNNVREHISLRD